MTGLGVTQPRGVGDRRRAQQPPQPRPHLAVEQVHRSQHGDSSSSPGHYRDRPQRLDGASSRATCRRNQRRQRGVSAGRARRAPRPSPSGPAALTISSASSSSRGHRAVVPVERVERLVRRLWASPACRAPSSRRPCAARTRAVGGAPPRRLGREVEVALPHGLAVAVGPRLEVLAVLAHRHGAIVPATRPRSRRSGAIVGPRRRVPHRRPGTGQPTEPSIWSSIRRLHSTAYSMGSVRVTGSMKPLTTMPMACSSERPRLIR